MPVFGRMHSIFHVFARNGRLNNADRAVETLGELDECDWDVVLFSEMRSASRRTTMITGDVSFSFAEATNAGGVATLLKKIHADS